MDPKVGDQRIHFRMVEPMIVSLLSHQKGTGFEPYKTSNGETIESIVSGEVSAASSGRSWNLFHASPKESRRTTDGGVGRIVQALIATPRRYDN